MNWKTEHRCVFCDSRLTTAQKYYSNGRCPACGHKGDSAGTIVATTEHPYYEHRKWLTFWKSARVYKPTETPTPAPI